MLSKTGFRPTPGSSYSLVHSAPVSSESLESITESPVCAPNKAKWSYVGKKTWNKVHGFLEQDAMFFLLWDWARRVPNSKGLGKRIQDGDLFGVCIEQGRWADLSLWPLHPENRARTDIYLSFRHSSTWGWQTCCDFRRERWHKRWVVPKFWGCRLASSSSIYVSCSCFVSWTCVTGHKWRASDREAVTQWHRCNGSAAKSRQLPDQPQVRSTKTRHQWTHYACEHVSSVSNLDSNLVTSTLTSSAHNFIPPPPQYLNWWATAWCGGEVGPGVVPRDNLRPWYCGLLSHSCSDWAGHFFFQTYPIHPEIKHHTVWRSWLHSLFGWKMIMLPILTASLIHFVFLVGRMYFLNMGVKGLKPWETALCFHWFHSKSCLKYFADSLPLLLNCHQNRGHQALKYWRPSPSNFTVSKRKLVIRILTLFQI